MRFLSNKILVGAFCGVLLAPTVANLCRFEPLPALFEKRPLAKLPDVKEYRFREPAQVAAYAQDWEKYYTDNFGLRKLLLGSYRLALFYLFGISANPAVVVGESDGQTHWLYFDGAEAGDGRGFKAFLGKQPYTPGDLVGIRANLARLSKLLEDNHIQFVVVACPDKQSVYPEYLPENRRPAPGISSRFEQMFGPVYAALGARYVDLRDPLIQAKAEAPVYYHTDTHWNERGIFVGYRAFMQVLQRQDPTRVPLSSSDIRWKNLPPVNGDLVGLLGLPWYPREAMLDPILPKEPSGGRRGKVLVLHDSFFIPMKPFLEFEFREVKMIRGVYNARELFLTQELLNAEKPDVVVIEAVERVWTW
jgi:alginate O-acetyltransferase complex protein AlgJ